MAGMEMQELENKGQYCNDVGLECFKQ